MRRGGTPNADPRAGPSCPPLSALIGELIMNRTLVAALVGLVSLAACQDDTSPVAVRHASMVTPSLDILVGSATDLGTLGGRDSYGYAVNILGEVVGMSDIVIPYGVSRPFLWNARDGIVDLGTFGGANAQASAINDL